MSNEFPRMLYRQPGAEPIHGDLFASCVVADAHAQEAALSGGWHLTTTDAKTAHDAAKEPAARPLSSSSSALDAPPTRAEMEQMAAKIGMKVDGRWSDKKLGEMIAAHLAAG